MGLCEAQAFQKTDYGAIAQVNSINIEVQFFSPTTVRIVKYPDGEVFEKDSLTVVKTPQVIEIETHQENGKLTLSSAQLGVVLNLENGSVSFVNAENRTLLKEQVNGTSFPDYPGSADHSHGVSQSFVLDGNEAIYGLGQQQQGRMVKRDIKLNMIQGNTDDYVPFFFSVKGYGLFWDNYSPTVFSDDETSTTFKSDIGDGVDYYFILGGDADGVIAGMRDLTGQAPMFPLWTFGYWQSKERYASQDELVDVVRKYREIQVPLDGIIQDWQYWGNNYLWNAMEFLNPNFPDPQKMVDEVHALNAHMIISIWSSFGPHTKPYRELKNIDALLDFTTWPEAGTEGWPPNPDYPSGVEVYDAFNPEARDIYWKYLNAGIFSLGMDGWWMDSTEPDHMQFKPSDLDNPTYLGTFREVRNAYPLMTVGGVYEHQRATESDKRVFILTRSVFAGQQRFGANIWSGDIVASWQALHNQISAGLSLSLCGIPYWNSDIGGFFLWDFDDPLQNEDYRELYVRWIEFGAFCPMMRSHGTDAPREIYQFGEPGDEVFDAIDKYIKLRYRLLPYIYSAAWDITANQSSMMRALVMDFPSDNNALDINDEYMFGDAILVCPVTEPMYSAATEAATNPEGTDLQSVKTSSVYLPAGADWYDFWDHAKYTGGQSIEKPTPLDTIPLYVKAGSILPLGPDVQYATEKPWDDLEIRVFEGADGSFTLYEDENDNYNYEQGIFSTIVFTWDDSERTLTIGERQGSFPGMLNERKFHLVFVGPEEVEKTVNYNGETTVISRD